jgi:hypothetical protein
VQLTLVPMPCCLPQVGQQVSLEGGLSLAQAVEHGLMQHMAAATAVADVANKEYAIEQVGTSQMIRSWLMLG